ncbi:MAG: trehalose-phosphatase [Acidimicrobiales bacterium]
MNDLRAATLVDLARAPSLLVVCEFDGVIADFVNDPTAARPIDGALDVLATLGSLEKTRAAVISGRSLDSLIAVCTAERDDLTSCGIELIGSDGMEIASQVTLGLTTDARRTQRRLLQAAGQVADAHPGVMIEEKPYGVALHVRGATANDAQHAIDWLSGIARSMPQRVYSQSRREVLDLSLLPVGQDWAIDALRQGHDTTVFYAGNDERALASLRGGDIGSTVGAGGSDSSLLVASPTELVTVLAQLCNERARALVSS